MAESIPLSSRESRNDFYKKTKVHSAEDAGTQIYSSTKKQMSFCQLSHWVPASSAEKE